MFPDHTNMVQDTATVGYDINLENSVNLVKSQSFTTSQAADSGSDGADGNTGPAGPTGSQGPAGIPGVTGSAGPGVTFTGDWEVGKTYNGGSAIKDVVEYTDGNYYIATADHTSTNTTGDFTTTGRPGTGTQVPWESFGAQFESVATDILLAQDSVITRGLVMGQADADGTGSFIRSVDKTGLGLESGSGFFLSSSGHFSFQKTGSNNSYVQMDSAGIEISSSKFHLKNDGDIIVKKVNATEGSVGGYNISGNDLTTSTGNVLIEGGVGGTITLGAGIGATANRQII